MKKKIKVWKPKSFKPVPKRITVKRTSNQKEYDTKWRKLSSAFRKTNVFCKHCLIEGVYTSEQLEVDHIIPITSNPDLKYDLKNLQVLCKSHHAKKTYSETLSKKE